MPKLRWHKINKYVSTDIKGKELFVDGVLRARYFRYSEPEQNIYHVQILGYGDASQNLIHYFKTDRAGVAEKLCLEQAK